MSILITGGCGYIGSHIAWAMADAGIDISILDDLSTGVRENAPPGVKIIVGDVGDEDLLYGIFQNCKIEAVIHLAGKILPSESIANPLLYISENTVNSIRLVRAMVKSGVPKLVFSSTAAVYGHSDTVEVDELAPTIPLSPYGLSKLMVEQALDAICTGHGLRAVALRYFNVAGADPGLRCGPRGPNPGHLIRTAIETALGHRPLLEVYGDDYPTLDGTCLRDYIHVSDLAQAHLAALADLGCRPGFRAMNCGYGRGSSVLEVIEAVKEVTGLPLPYTVTSRRPGDPPGLVANTDRLRRLGTWTPRFGRLQDIVRSSVEWEAFRHRS